jgi:hypothetical protein
MEPTNRSRTWSVDDKSRLENSTSISFGLAETNLPYEKPDVTNAGNEESQPHVDNSGTCISDIDEVNGLGATEVPFTTTRHELLVLVKHWASVALEIQYYAWLIGSISGTDDSFRWLYALGRLARGRELLGHDVVDRTFGEAEEDFRRSLRMTLREWDIFRHGTSAEKEPVWLKFYERGYIDGDESQMSECEKEQEESLQRAEMEEWRAQHQAARDRTEQEREERMGRIAPENGYKSSPRDQEPTPPT